ncbi:hypothetical protein JL721_2630 [Aureococcus anophagefferens]|nr:hypothetical protein JL721_2630 [Aureococcus anophagefferens]
MAGANVDVVKMGIDRVYERRRRQVDCKGYPCYFLFKAGAAADATPVRYAGADDEVERFVDSRPPPPTRGGGRGAYVKVAKKLADGEAPSYLADEIARIAKLLKDTSLSSAKRKDFSARKNILNAFAVAATAAKAHGGEL